MQWPKRARRKQSVARIPQNATLVLCRFDELFDERSLSDSSFTTHESNTAVSMFDPGQCVLQLVEKVRARVVPWVESPLYSP